MNLNGIDWNSLQIISGHLISATTGYAIKMDMESKSSFTNYIVIYLCKDMKWRTATVLDKKYPLTNKAPDIYATKEEAEKQLKAYFDKHPKNFAKYSAARMLKGVTT